LRAKKVDQRDGGVVLLCENIVDSKSKCVVTYFGH